MSMFARFAGSDSDDESPTPSSGIDPMRMLAGNFSFLPPAATIKMPAGWFGLLKMAARRLSCVVPLENWGTSFRVTSITVRDGAFEIEAVGGTRAVAGVLRKVRRASMAICCDCGKPGILFPGKLGLQPHCPTCLPVPALLDHLDKVLGWRAGLEGPGGMGVRLHRIPPTLRASFWQWQRASGLDARALQPWDLEGWLRDLARAQRTLRRAYS